MCGVVCGTVCGIVCGAVRILEVFSGGVGVTAVERHVLQTPILWLQATQLPLSAHVPFISGQQGQIVKIR